MSEMLQVYDIENNLLESKDRKEVYDEMYEEFEHTGSITRKVKTIRCLLMNSEGNIYLQKRSRKKSQNPGMYDKTIGGHVVADQSWDMTLVKECAEELGIPSNIVSTHDFENGIKSVDLGIIGIFKELDMIKNFGSIRKIDNQMIIYPQITKIYLGYYDGMLKFIDGEVCGIEAFSLAELEEDMRKYPENFTEDIKLMVEKYKDCLVPISEL